MPVERLLYDAALHAASAAVNHSHLIKARSGGGVDILCDDRRDVARRECMQIELTLDRDPEAISHQRSDLATYSAFTTVLIPPRTEKSPTTVIRRG